jgi:CheY-like chemotaxis protein
MLHSFELEAYFATLAAVTLVPWFAQAVAVVLLAMRDRHASIEHGLQERAVIFVALTGYGQFPDRQRSEDGESDVHLVKPIEPRRLEQVLTREHEVTSGKSGDRR